MDKLITQKGFEGLTYSQQQIEIHCAKLYMIVSDFSADTSLAFQPE